MLNLVGIVNNVQIAKEFDSHALMCEVPVRNDETKCGVIGNSAHTHRWILGAKEKRNILRRR